MERSGDRRKKTSSLAPITLCNCVPQLRDEDGEDGDGVDGAEEGTRQAGGQQEHRALQEVEETRSDFDALLQACLDRHRETQERK